jgi:hypothetical protein
MRQNSRSVRFDAIDRFIAVASGRESVRRGGYSPVIRDRAAGVGPVLTLAMKRRTFSAASSGAYARIGQVYKMQKRWHYFSS